MPVSFKENRKRFFTFYQEEEAFVLNYDGLTLDHPGRISDSIN